MVAVKGVKLYFCAAVCSVFIFGGFLIFARSGDSHPVIYSGGIAFITSGADETSVMKTSAAAAGKTAKSVKTAPAKTSKTTVPKTSKERITSAAAETEASAEIYFVELNEASPEDLMQLPGISEEQAYAIIDLREAFGEKGYPTVYELLFAYGMTKEKLTAILPYIYITGAFEYNEPGYSVRTVDIVYPPYSSALG